MIGDVLDEVPIIRIRDTDNIVSIPVLFYDIVLIRVILTQSYELKASSQLQECVDVSLW